MNQADNETQCSVVLAAIYRVGGNHKSAIKQAGALNNMLKAEARRYVGFEALASGTGRGWEKGKCEAAYRRLIDEQEDVAFSLATAHLQKAAEDAKRLQDRYFRELGKLAAQLPVAAWCEKQRGCSLSMLGKIIFEAGRDLNDYPSPAKLWKRFGLHVVDGKAVRMTAGKEMGFDPYRRSVARQLAEGLMKAGDETNGWRRVYLEEKERQRDRAAAEGKTIKPAGAMAAKEKADPARFMSDGHVHNRALRYTAKKFLEALWQEWTGNARAENLPAFIRELEAA